MWTLPNYYKIKCKGIWLTTIKYGDIISKHVIFTCSEMKQHVNNRTCLFYEKEKIYEEYRRR